MLKKCFFRAMVLILGGWAVTTASLSISEAAALYSTDALIYGGASVAYGDVDAISGILDTLKLTYRVASSDDLNQMSLEQLTQYGMIIWPGGYAGNMSGSMTASARELIRRAVTEKGVSFVGICAGAFIAVSPSTATGESGPRWGLSLIPGDLLPYFHLEDEGTEYSMVKVKFSGGDSRSLVWWGGPLLPEVKDGVIARYEDLNQPAIIETHAGQGFVILSGPHPEAPQSWRTKLGLQDPDGLDQDIAGKLFLAALHRQKLPTL